MMRTLVLLVVAFACGAATPVGDGEVISRDRRCAETSHAQNTDRTLQHHFGNVGAQAQRNNDMLKKLLFEVTGMAGRPLAHVGVQPIVIFAQPINTKATSPSPPPNDPTTQSPQDGIMAFNSINQLPGPVILPPTGPAVESTTAAPPVSTQLDSSSGNVTEETSTTPSTVESNRTAGSQPAASSNSTEDNSANEIAVTSESAITTETSNASTGTTQEPENATTVATTTEGPRSATTLATALNATSTLPKTSGATDGLNAITESTSKAGDGTTVAPKGASTTVAPTTEASVSSTNATLPAPSQGTTDSTTTEKGTSATSSTTEAPSKPTTTASSKPETTTQATPTSTSSTTTSAPVRTTSKPPNSTTRAPQVTTEPTATTVKNAGNAERTLEAVGDTNQQNSSFEHQVNRTRVTIQHITSTEDKVTTITQTIQPTANHTTAAPSPASSTTATTP